MFSYLRYFSVISAVIVTIAAIALGYYFRSSAENDIGDLVIKNNQVLTQGFINNVWKSHEMVKMLALFSKHKVTPENWHRYRGYKENFENFNRDVFKYFEEMPVVHVTVYDRNGAKLLSFNQSQILSKTDKGVQSDDPSASRNTVKRALSGSIASTILQNSKFQIADGSHRMGTVVQTAVPILSNNYVPLVAGAAGYDKKSNLEGMVEIYYDVTRQWEQLAQFQYLGTGAIIFIFLLLIGTLILVAAKAEEIITKQHDANNELTAQAAAASAENENKSQFLASISHELRTPLNAIIGFSEIIKNETMGAIGNSQYKDYIKDIHNSGVHLLSLINDILDYSKAEAGKLELQMEEVDVTKLIHASIRLVSPRAEHAKVKLHAEVPKEHYVIYTDGKKVKQVLLNLLSNAVKFTPEGGAITTTLWQDVMDNSLSIEVKDSGIGISPKDISKALSPFGQVDSALSRKYEGTGLGLPLTKKFVEIMGGAFTMESEEGKGTSVRFSLPMNAVPPAQEETPSAPEPAAKAEPEMRTIEASKLELNTDAPISAPTEPFVAATAAVATNETEEPPVAKETASFESSQPTNPEPEAPKPASVSITEAEPLVSSPSPSSDSEDSSVAKSPAPQSAEAFKAASTAQQLATPPQPSGASEPLAQTPSSDETKQKSSEPFLNPLQDPALTQAPSKSGFSEDAFQLATDKPDTPQN